MRTLFLVRLLGLLLLLVPCFGVDSTPPIFSVGPATANVTETTADLAGTLDEDGTVYYLIIADGATAPSVSEVQNPGSYVASTVIDSGNMLTSSSAFGFSVSGLTEGTAYDIYVVAEDDEGTPNVQAAVTLVDMTTVADVTAPALSPSPSAQNAQAGSIDLLATSTEDGTIYYLVLADMSSVPSVSQITGDDPFPNGGQVGAVEDSGNAAVSASNLESITISGLTDATTYDVFMIAEDDAQAENKSEIFAMTFTMPGFTSPISISNQTDEGFTINGTYNRTGAVYYILVADGEPDAPTAQQVENGTNYDAVTIVTSGNINVTADGAFSLPVNGLDDNTDYDLYVAGSDSSNDLSSVSMRDVSTLADTTAPDFTTGPTLLNPVADGFDIQGTLNENGTVWYVVQLDGQAAPADADEVIATGASTAVIANTPFDIPISGLLSETVYDVFIVGRDEDLNKSVVTGLSITTGDGTAPTFSVAPFADSAHETGFDLNGTIDEDGTIYYLIIADGEPTAPNAAQVQAGVDYSAVTVLGSGNVAASDSIAFNTSITGLTISTDYDVYVTAVDATNNALTPVKIDVSTTGDITAPIFSAGPALNNAIIGGFDITGTLNETGTCWYLVQAGGTTPPADAATVIATGSSAAVTADTPFTINVTGLGDQMATFDVYVVGSDGASNATSYVSLSIDTLDGVAPILTVAPSASNINENGFDLSAMSDESGTMSYIVVADGDAVPTATQIIAAVDYTGATVLESGNSAVVASTTFTHLVSGLSASTDYDVHLVVTDAGGNHSAVALLDVSTVAVAPPFFRDGTPTVHTISTTSVQVSVNMSESCTVYAMVLAAGATAPTINEVKLIDTYSDALAVIYTTNESVGAANVTTDIALMSLTASTQYDVYLVAEDGDSNDSAIQAQTFNTLDSAAPIFTTSLTPVSTWTTASLTFQVNEDYRLYYVLLPDGSTAPSVNQIQAGQDASGSLVTLSAQDASYQDAGADRNVSFNTLTPGTTYDLYLVLEDDESTPHVSAATRVEITTVAAEAMFLGDLSSPFINSVWSETLTVTSEADLTVTGAVLSNAPTNMSVINNGDKTVTVNMGVGNAGEHFRALLTITYTETGGSSFTEEKVFTVMVDPGNPATLHAPIGVN